jgi:hypothetical protein
MKFKALARSEKACTKELASDVRMRPRNTAPELHPFAKAREYRRALNAVKLEKVFAKPFVGALDGHTDGVWCSSSPHESLVQFISGACDGEVGALLVRYRCKPACSVANLFIFHFKISRIKAYVLAPIFFYLIDFTDNHN